MNAYDQIEIFREGDGYKLVAVNEEGIDTMRAPEVELPGGAPVTIDSGDSSVDLTSAGNHDFEITRDGETVRIRR